MHIIKLTLGNAWAAPLSVFGLLAALVGRVRFIGTRDGVLEFIARPGGLIAWAFRSTRTVGASGLWGCVAFYSTIPTEQVRRHEHRHARQAMALGILWPLAYALASLASAARGSGWYWGNALEYDARKAAGE